MNSVTLTQILVVNGILLFVHLLFKSALVGAHRETRNEQFIAALITFLAPILTIFGMVLNASEILRAFPTQYPHPSEVTLTAIVFAIFWLRDLIRS